MASTLGALNPFRYRGYVYDTETGFYYLQSRYYDPEVGRFLNADIYMSTGQGILGNNMYVYCLNNPTALTDESGTEPISITIGIVGITVAMLLYAATVAIVPAITDAGALDGVGDIELPSPENAANQIGAIVGAVILAKLSTMKPREYRSETEKHHIVLQKSSDPLMVKARSRLESVNIKVDSSYNIVSIKTGLHRRLHTKIYKGLIYTGVELAYRSGRTYEQKQANVVSFLKLTKGILSNLSRRAPF